MVEVSLDQGAVHSGLWANHQPRGLASPYLLRARAGRTSTLPQSCSQEVVLELFAIFGYNSAFVVVAAGYPQICGKGRDV
jgi:hypothetical protein